MCEPVNNNDTPKGDLPPSVRELINGASGGKGTPLPDPRKGNPGMNQNISALSQMLGAQQKMEMDRRVNHDIIPSQVEANCKSLEELGYTMKGIIPYSKQGNPHFLIVGEKIIPVK